jgi:uncharacterized CHY-type Zn-finger protein
MGTNYYWHLDETILPNGHILPVDWDNPLIHIGKRAGAGLYCYHCNLTLCKQDIVSIHTGHSEWYKVCPKCGQGPAKETLDDSAGGIELGFAKLRKHRPVDVRSTSSFSWAQEPSDVQQICKEHPDEELIQDEYGTVFTCQEFLNMLNNNCPIFYKHSIGKWFS